MTCDRCKHQADVLAGKFRDLPFEATPCSDCDWSEPSSLGTVEFNEDLVPVDAAEALRPSARPDVDALPLAVFSKALGILMRLRPESRDVVCMRARGMTFPAIARKLGTTIATVEMRYVRSVRRFPVLITVCGRAAALQGGHVTGDFGQANGL